MRSTYGILQALEFLEDVLLGGAHGDHDNDGEEEEEEKVVIEADSEHSRRKRSMGYKRSERDLSMGVYDFLTEEDVETSQRIHRSKETAAEQRILPEHEENAAMAVKMTREECRQLSPNLNSN
jgi:hypothetical protein